MPKTISFVINDDGASEFTVSEGIGIAELATCATICQFNASRILAAQSQAQAPQPIRRPVELVRAASVPADLQGLGTIARES